MKEIGKPGILVFATGSANGGGSGALEMAEYSRTELPGLNADILAFVSNHENGGVRKHADSLEVPFEFWNGPFSAEGYQSLERKYKPDLTMLSGWLKMVKGLDPKKTINIHPGPLPGNGSHGEFGGERMYGHYVHEAVMRAYREGRVNQSAVTIHFVTEKYDRGPIIWQMPVLIRRDDTPDTLANRVNQVERAWQSHIVNLVANKLIVLMGDNSKNWYVAANRTIKDLPGLVTKSFFNKPALAR